jgi:hypothetical protein
MKESPKSRKPKQTKITITAFEYTRKKTTRSNSIALCRNKLNV